MSDQTRPELVRDDDELTRELRAIYAGPTEATYWVAFEQRVMARLDAGGDMFAWWSVSDRWLRTGLIAAGLAVVVAGSLLLRGRAQASQIAVEQALDSSAVDAFEIARRDRLSEEQEALRRLTGR